MRVGERVMCTKNKDIMDMISGHSAMMLEMMIYNINKKMIKSSYSNNKRF